MGKIILAISVFLGLNAFAQVLLSESLDPREVTLPDGIKLWSEVQIEKMKDRPLRTEILTASTLFLESKMPETQFISELNVWGKIGFNEQERNILIDTLKKRNLKSDSQKKWICRLELAGCALQKLSVAHLPAILQKFEWLVVDGNFYPRIAWDEVLIPNENLSFLFLSSRFETYTFTGKWEDLKLKNIMLHAWVSGNCDQYQVSNEVQSLENTVMLNRQCFKTSVTVLRPTESFYDKNKKWIWIAAGLVVGAGAFNELSGKNIIIEKPSFK